MESNKVGAVEATTESFETGKDEEAEGAEVAGGAADDRDETGKDEAEGAEEEAEVAGGAALDATGAAEW